MKFLNFLLMPKFTNLNILDTILSEKEISRIVCNLV